MAKDRLPLSEYPARRIALIKPSALGDIVHALTVDFYISTEQMGAILSPAFWGFTLSLIIGGSPADWLGMRNLLLTSIPGHAAAVQLTNDHVPLQPVVRLTPAARHSFRMPPNPGWNPRAPYTGGMAQILAVPLLPAQIMRTRSLNRYRDPAE